MNYIALIFHETFYRVSEKSELRTDVESQKIYCGLRSVNARRYTRDYFIHDDDDRVAGPDLSFSPDQTVHLVDATVRTSQPIRGLSPDHVISLDK